MLETLIHIDQQCLLWMNGHHSLFFDRLMFAVSGRFEWIPLYFGILACIIWKFRWKSVWIILAIVIMITLTDQISNLLKSGVRRLRPCKDPDIGYLVHLVHHYCSGSFGFISAHAANSFGLATFISMLARKKWISTGMFCWATLVSYSRIYLGVHYPGDVLGGAVIGTMLAWIAYSLVHRFVKLAEV